MLLFLSLRLEFELFLKDLNNQKEIFSIIFINLYNNNCNQAVKRKSKIESSPLQFIMMKLKFDSEAKSEINVYFSYILLDKCGPKFSNTNYHIFSKAQNKLFSLLVL